MTEPKRRPALSVVVPVFNEEGNVAPLHGEISQVMAAIGRPYEILFVNDGSIDATLDRLAAIALADPALRIVDLDGNFGEAAALSAGFATARGDVVITLDGDGQNDPHDIPKLLAKLDEGFDAVSGRRQQRREAFFTRVLPSWVANTLIARATRVPVYDCGCGLKAYRRELLAGTQLPRGFNRFLPAILGVDRRRVAEIPTRDRPRGSGASHYGLSRLFVVLRDIPSLPFLVRRPAPGASFVRTLALTEAALAAAVLVAFVLRPTALFTALGIPAILVAAAIRHNVSRLVHARDGGVFRVRRVLDGNAAAVEDRHRRRGVLGAEPPPHLRPAVGGAGH